MRMIRFYCYLTSHILHKQKIRDRPNKARKFVFVAVVDKFREKKMQRRKCYLFDKNVAKLDNTTKATTTKTTTL